MAHFGTERVQRSTRKDHFCPVWFEHGGRSGKAILIDISRKGAKLVGLDLIRSLRIRERDTLELTIWTPYGVSCCHAVVRWITREKDECRWGVEFTEVAHEAQDPIRRLVDSVSPLSRAFT